MLFKLINFKVIVSYASLMCNNVCSSRLPINYRCVRFELIIGQVYLRYAWVLAQRYSTTPKNYRKYAFHCPIPSSSYTPAELSVWASVYALLQIEVY